jgi:RNA polymerase subunit RPABC4/transcription elongation factor Spt4
MNGTEQVSGAWNERMRLTRLRRRKEKLRFIDEFRLVPRWLIAVVVVVFVVAQAVAVFVNLGLMASGGETWAPELRNDPVASTAGLMGVITLGSVFMAAYIFLIAYVNRDAKRRGMMSGLWTLLVLILSWPFMAIGFIIYFLMREPLPYPCPACGNTVGARFNFCPNCKCNLYPACAQCKREIAETDKFCPYCGNGLKAAAEGAEVSAQNSM